MGSIQIGNPPVVVKPGDLVIVRYGLGNGEMLAEFLGAPFTARVRLWDAPLGQWGREVDRMIADVLRLAPEDERTAAARAAKRASHLVALRPPEAFGLTAEEMAAQVALGDELLAEIVAEERGKGATYETAAVLAGAYKGRRLSLRVTHTHTVEMTDEGRWSRVLCDRVSLDSLAEPSEVDNPAAEPTCPLCAAKDPRFATTQKGATS